jgi:hypothetical protein
MMIEMLHVDAELPEITIGIRLHVSDELIEGFACLFQIPEDVCLFMGAASASNEFKLSRG